MKRKIVFLFVFWWIVCAFGQGRKALLIGVSQARDTKIRKLPGVEKDLENMKRCLETHGGFSVEVLPNEQATTERVRSALSTLFRETSLEFAVIFFATHGKKMKNSTGQEELFFVMYDSRLNAMEELEDPSKALKTTELFNTLGYIASACTKLVLVDACFSSTMLLQSQLSQANLQNCGLFLGSTKDEPAREVDRGGVFTISLVRAMQGDADKNRDRQVSIGEIEKDAKDNVEKWTGRRQNPQFFYGNITGQFREKEITQYQDRKVIKNLAIKVVNDEKIRGMFEAGLPSDWKIVDKMPQHIAKTIETIDRSIGKKRDVAVVYQEEPPLPVIETEDWYYLHAEVKDDSVEKELYVEFRSISGSRERWGWPWKERGAVFYRQVENFLRVWKQNDCCWIEDKKYPKIERLSCTAKGDRLRIEGSCRDDVSVSMVLIEDREMVVPEGIIKTYDFRKEIPFTEAIRQKNRVRCTALDWIGRRDTKEIDLEGREGPMILLQEIRPTDGRNRARTIFCPWERIDLRLQWTARGFPGKTKGKIVVTGKGIQPYQAWIDEQEIQGTHEHRCSIRMQEEGVDGKLEITAFVQIGDRIASKECSLEVAAPRLRMKTVMMDDKNEEKSDFQPAEKKRLKVSWGFDRCEALIGETISISGRGVKPYSTSFNEREVGRNVFSWPCPIELTEIREGEYEVEASLMIEGRIFSQKTRFRLFPSSSGSLYGLPESIWASCNYNHNGQSILDMTTDTWCGLSVADQQKYATQYQEGYAAAYQDEEMKIKKNKGIPVEKTVTISGVEFGFRLIPPGRFWRGSPKGEKDRDSDEARHRVVISQPFYLGKTEVTQKQWAAVTKKNPSFFKGEDLPVENVSWTDCESFAKSTGLSMPTEAQWEYACRGGTTGRFYWGESESEMGRYANVADRTAKGKYSDWNIVDTEDGFADIAPVGSLKPNSFGLHDMCGNVWEWCSDWYGNYPSGDQIDPIGAQNGSYRVYRGGSWSSNVVWGLRSAYRGWDQPSYAFSVLGVRLFLRP